MPVLPTVGPSAVLPGLLARTANTNHQAGKNKAPVDVGAATESDSGLFQNLLLKNELAIRSEQQAPKTSLDHSSGDRSEDLATTQAVPNDQDHTLLTNCIETCELPDSALEIENASNVAAIDEPDVDATEHTDTVKTSIVDASAELDTATDAADSLVLQVLNVVPAPQAVAHSSRPQSSDDVGQILKEESVDREGQLSQPSKGQPQPLSKRHAAFQTGPVAPNDQKLPSGSQADTALESSKQLQDLRETLESELGARRSNTRFRRPDIRPISHQTGSAFEAAPSNQHGLKRPVHLPEQLHSAIDSPADIDRHPVSANLTTSTKKIAPTAHEEAARRSAGDQHSFSQVDSAVANTTLDQQPSFAANGKSGDSPTVISESIESVPSNHPDQNSVETESDPSQENQSAVDPPEAISKNVETSVVARPTGPKSNGRHQEVEHEGQLESEQIQFRSRPGQQSLGREPFSDGSIFEPANLSSPSTRSISPPSRKFSLPETTSATDIELADPVNAPSMAASESLDIVDADLDILQQLLAKETAAARHTDGVQRSIQTDSPDLPNQITSRALAEAEILQTGDTARFQMKLDPPELGSVMIDMQKSSHGTTVTVTAVEPATQQLLQESLHHLNQSNAGESDFFEQLSFDLSTGDHQQEQNSQSNDARSEAAAVRSAESEVLNDESDGSSHTTTTLDFVA